MKLGMWTGGNVLIMHFILFRCRMKIVVAMVVKLLQNHLDPEITQQLFKLAWWNLVCEQVVMCWLCKSVLFSLSHINCGCYGNKNSQNVVPVVYLCVAGNTCVCYTWLWRCTVACCSTIYGYQAATQLWWLSYRHLCITSGRQRSSTHWFISKSVLDGQKHFWLLKWWMKSTSITLSIAKGVFVIESVLLLAIGNAALF